MKNQNFWIKNSCHHLGEPEPEIGLLPQPARISDRYASTSVQDSKYSQTPWFLLTFKSRNRIRHDLVENVVRSLHRLLGNDSGLLQKIWKGFKSGKTFSQINIARVVFWPNDAAYKCHKCLAMGTIIGSDLVCQGFSSTPHCSRCHSWRSQWKKKWFRRVSKIFQWTYFCYDPHLLQSNLIFRSWVCVPSLANYKC